MVEAANLNPRIAEEKAALCMQLNRLLHTPPPARLHSVDPADARVQAQARHGALGAAQPAREPAGAAVGHRCHAGVSLR